MCAKQTTLDFCWPISPDPKVKNTHFKSFDGFIDMHQEVCYESFPMAVIYWLLFKLNIMYSALQRALGIKYWTHKKLTTSELESNLTDQNKTKKSRYKKAILCSATQLQKQIQD